MSEYQRVTLYKVVKDHGLLTFRTSGSSSLVGGEESLLPKLNARHYFEVLEDDNICCIRFALRICYKLK